MINAFTGGGAEKLLHDTVILQKSYGIDVTIYLLSTDNNHYLDSVREAGVNVIISKQKSLYSPKHILKIRSIIDNYDLVHVHLFPSLYWTSLASLFLKHQSKLVLTEHSTHNRRRNNRILRPIERFIYNQYDHIFCISKATETNLHKWLPSTINKTTVVPNGIDLSEYRNAKPYKKSQLSPRLKESDKLIVMVARFDQQKDQDTLVKALGYLDKEYKLLLVGTGEREEEVKKLAKTEGVADRIIFLGFRKDVPNILKTSDLFVLSSHWEGFGLVAVEAMASGIPVLVSNVEGLREVVDNKDMTFPQGDSKRLAEKVTSTLGNKSTTRDFISYGLERCKRFSIENMVKDIINQNKYLLNRI